jgi:hypothetical protein
MTQQDDPIVLNKLMSTSDGTYVSIKPQFQEQIRTHIIERLRRVGFAKIDLSGIRSLSPSLAYEVFGKLVDESDLKIDKSKIQFLNDERGLSDRIWDAIDRRRKFFNTQAC